MKFSHYIVNIYSKRVWDQPHRFYGPVQSICRVFSGVDCACRDNNILFVLMFSQWCRDEVVLNTFQKFFTLSMWTMLICCGKLPILFPFELPITLSPNLIVQLQSRCVVPSDRVLDSLHISVTCSIFYPVITHIFLFQRSFSELSRNIFKVFIFDPRKLTRLFIQTEQNIPFSNNLELIGFFTT